MAKKPAKSVVESAVPAVVESVSAPVIVEAPIVESVSAPAIVEAPAETATVVSAVNYTMPIWSNYIRLAEFTDFIRSKGKADTEKKTISIAIAGPDTLIAELAEVSLKDAKGLNFRSYIDSAPEQKRKAVRADFLAYVKKLLISWNNYYSYFNADTLRREITEKIVSSTAGQQTIKKYNNFISACGTEDVVPGQKLYGWLPQNVVFPKFDKHIMRRVYQIKLSDLGFKGKEQSSAGGKRGKKALPTIEETIEGFAM